eukprot:Skav213825  [mRNA]  locus=scaffold1987:702643:703845:+ [translate_table: standard]
MNSLVDEDDEAQSMMDDVLKMAVKTYSAKVVDKLIGKHQARHDLLSKDGQTLLHEASQHPSPKQALEICQLLVKKYNMQVTMLNKQGQTAAFYAAKLGHAQLCQYLLQEGCEVDQVDMAQQTALFYAARNGHIGAADVFLQEAANVNFKDFWGFTPIFWAAEGGKVQMMKYLVGKGANTELLSTTGGDLFTSANGGAMAFAVELGADPRRSLILGQTNLFVAAKGGNFDKVRMCIEEFGLDVNDVDENGQTCLFYAASSGGHVITQKLLTQYHASTLLQDVHGRTVLKQIEDCGSVNLKVHKLLAEAHKKQQKATQAAEKKRRAAALREQKRQEKAEKQRQQQEKRRQAEEKARLERQRAEESLREQQRAARASAASSSKRARSPSINRCNTRRKSRRNA